MGSLEYMLEDLAVRLGVEYVPPPQTTLKTIELGVKNSPEFACLPLKITIGNFIQAIEAGSDLLIMAGGCGPCRFGYYAEVQRIILENLGYKFEMIIIEPPGAHPIQFVRAFKKLGRNMSIKQIYNAIKISFKKAQAFDFIEKRMLEIRPFEIQRGIAKKNYIKAREILREAKNEDEIEELKKIGFEIIESTPCDFSRNILRVGLVGEFYILLEPIMNFDIEKWLGENGVMVERSVYTSDWIGSSKSNPVAGISNEILLQEAKPYLSHFVGGEGVITIGHIAHFAKNDYDGAIHLFPFTCMPETIAKSIIPKVSGELNMPVLSITIDEQTGKAGIVTRLEAMLDLMLSKRRAKKESLCAVS